ncbi:MAG TPA: hypothetical protein VLH85_04570 [Levilinea sp.]|nr:hypothetical protein [Levilinea sp.]
MEEELSCYATLEIALPVSETLIEAQDWHHSGAAVYLLDTAAVKKLPYLNFMDGDWTSSKDAWRAASERQLTVIVVLEYISG